MNTKYIVGGLIAVLLIILGGYIYTNQEETSNVPSEDQAQIENQDQEDTDSEDSEASLVIEEDLQEVSFCGETYQSKQIFIDGVEVVSRIAEIATEKEEILLICENIENNTNDSNFSVSAKLLEYPEQPVNIYTVVIPGNGFSINTKTQEISLIDPYGGRVIGSY